MGLAEAPLGSHWSCWRAWCHSVGGTGCGPVYFNPCKDEFLLLQLYEGERFWGINRMGCDFTRMLRRKRQKISSASVSSSLRSCSDGCWCNAEVTWQLHFQHRFHLLCSKTNRQRKCNCFQRSSINRRFSEYVLLNAACTKAWDFIEKGTQWTFSPTAFNAVPFKALGDVHGGQRAPAQLGRARGPGRVEGRQPRAPLLLHVVGPHLPALPGAS